MKNPSLPLILAIAFFVKPSYQAAKANPVSYSSSISDCFSYVKQTRCTECLSNDNGPDWPFGSGATPEDTPYETVSCNFPGICVDGVQRNPCTWRRYHGETCVETGGNFIHSSGTNSLPDHCYYSETSAPVGSSSAFNTYYFSRVWNLPVTSTLKYEGDVTNG